MMKNKSMVLVGIIIALIIMLFSNVVFADATIIIGGNTTQNTQTENTVQNTTTNTTTNTTQTPSTTTNVSTTTNRVNTTEKLPQTGVTDGYVVAILVVVCAISAIYAYRKIRDYNIKD